MSRASRFGRVAFSFLAAMALCMMSIFSLPLHAADEIAAGARWRTGEAAILEALDELTEMQFVETPLEEVMEYISQRHRVTTWFDEDSMEGAGASPQINVSIELRGIRLRSALDLLLQEMELTWDIRHEVLEICSKEDYEGRYLTKVYDIADLVDRSQRRFTYPDDLKDVITSIVEPQSWGEGNNTGIGLFPAALSIPQSRQSHDQIARLLDDIRRAKGLKPLYAAVDSESTKAIEQALEMTWDVDFRAQPLSAVLSGLSEKFGINVYANGKGLEDIGVSIEDLVTVKVRGLKLQDALSLVLRETSAEVDWMVHADVLWITSRKVVAQSTPIKVHNVSDLLDSGRIKSEDELTDAIENGEGEYQDTWDTSGGPGSLEYLPGLLIVDQTRPVHRFVERLLADLRSLPPPPAAPPKENKITLKVYRVDGMEAERMAEAVTKFVEPESWQAAGGEGTIEAIAGTRPGDANPWVKEQPPQPAPAVPAAPQTAPGLIPLKQFCGFFSSGGGAQIWHERSDTFRTLPDGWLIVRQRESVHQKIAELLFDMRGLPTDRRRTTVGTSE